MCNYSEKSGGSPPDCTSLLIFMMLLLIALLYTALVQSHGELLVEPSDQEVVLGRTATFHCNTRSSKAYWRVNDNTFEFDGLYSHFPDYQYSNSSDAVFYNITLKINTSVAVNKLTIRCFYALSSASDIHHSRIARLTTLSCLALPQENLEVEAATFYYNVKQALTKITFELPKSCENLLVNYTIFAEDMNGTVVHSMGPIQYRGHWRVKEEITGGLKRDQLYFIQVEADMIEPMERVSPKWALDTHIILNSTCTQPNQGQLTVVVSSTGAVLLVMFLFIIIAVCLGIVAFTRRRKRNRQRHHEGQSFSNCMVPNPIYDGPMYESIFSKVTLSPSSDCPSPTSSCQSRDPNKSYENINTTSPPLRSPKSVVCPFSDSAPPDNELYIPKLSSKTSIEENQFPFQLLFNKNLKKQDCTSSTGISNSQDGTCPSDDNYITLSPIGAEFSKN